jgi:phage terminase large subunit-like protein
MSPDPFTLEHFRGWAQQWELDNGETWVLEPFQEDFIADMFTGFSIGWLVVPEGNGKTTLLAGLALYHLEYTQSGYVAVAASSRDQAEWIYRQAAGFVARSDRAKEFKCLEGYRRIRYDQMDARIQVFAADDRSGDGAIATLFILDELHRHRDLALYNTWSGKLRKRGGQLIAISTAGELGGEFEQERVRFRQSGAARRKPGFVRVEAENAVLHEWALEEGADPEDLDAVKRANPFSGVSLDYLRQKRELPGMTATHWQRFTCNRPGRAIQAAIQEGEWDAAAVDDEIPAGEPIFLGLDVAWKWDTTALVPLWVREPGYRLLGPAVVLEPPRDGTSLDPYLVEDALVKVHNRNPIHTVVMDTSAAEQLGAWIEAELGAVVMDRSQTNPNATQDYSRFMEALRSGWLHHTGDRTLRRHVLNGIARVLPGGDARFDRPAKSRYGIQDTRVIDALVAAAMANSLAEIETDIPEPMFAFG